MTNTETYYAMVAQFMATFDQPRYRATSKVPDKVRRFRGDLIDEEYKEYRQGCVHSNKLEMLDGLCDLAYVVAGTIVTCGLSVTAYTSKQGISDWHMEKEVMNAVDECDQPIPCHARMYAALNGLLMRIDQIGVKLNMFEAFKEVHKNNMDKLWKEKPAATSNLIALPRNGKWLVKDLNGKVIKPINHPKPDISKFLP